MGDKIGAERYGPGSRWKDLAGGTVHPSETWSRAFRAGLVPRRPRSWLRTGTNCSVEQGFARAGRLCAIASRPVIHLSEISGCRTQKIVTALYPMRIIPR